LFDVAEGEAGDDGDIERSESIAEDFFEAEAGAFDAAVAAAVGGDACPQSTETTPLWYALP
jgi:hypothetical protein